jgi:hypothetical protein
MRALAMVLMVGGLARAEAPVIDGATREKMTFCTDGKSHYVGIAPHETHGTQLFYGDGKQLFVLPDENRFVPTSWFHDPRVFSKTNNENFRGLDLRLFSHVDLDDEKQTCSVTCGERTTDLKIVPAADAKTLAAKAKILASPRTRTPYALARDNRAIYYYVDRGIQPGTEKSFHLYRGPKGALKLQKMTDVASDSEGEIFATRTGSLRLVLGRKEGNWLEGDKSTALTLVPVEQNLQMIYNELGVYAGQRLGTPCDDL